MNIDEIRRTADAVAREQIAARRGDDGDTRTLEAARAVLTQAQEFLFSIDSDAEAAEYARAIDNLRSWMPNYPCY